MIVNNKSYLVSKIENAQRVLSASSPWLEPVIDKMGISMVNDDNLSIIGFPNMWFFIGENFLAKSTHDELYFSLEYSIFQALNDSLKRASSISANNPKNLSYLSVSLEINDSLKKRYDSLSLPEWKLSMSKYIDESYLEVFHAKNIPTMPESFWLPQDFDIESGLTAENYVKKLIDYSQELERNWLEERIDNAYKNKLKEKSINLKKNDNINNETESVQKDSVDDNSEELNLHSSQDFFNESSQKSTYEIINESIDNSSEEFNNYSDGEIFKNLNESIPDASDVISRSQIRSYSIEQFIEDETLLALISMRGGGDGYEGISYQDKSDMEKEISKSIDEYGFQNPGLNKNYLGLWKTWSERVKRKSKSVWKNKLNSKLSPMLGKAVQSGETDLSFSKRNPNQQPDQPLMMGMVTFDPNINVLVDASPSMLKHQSITISEATAVIQKVLLKYSTPADIAMVDNKVRYVFKTQTPNKRMKKALSRTYSGGSEGFGKVLGTTLKKGLRYKGGNYPKPDLVIVITDCFFHDWPFPEKSSLPHKFGKLIIISTEPWDKVKDYLPKWVKRKENFFEAI